MKKFITTFGPAVFLAFFIWRTARYLDDHEYGSAFVTGSAAFVILLWAASADIVNAIKELRRP